MELANIEKLLEKYFEGETTLSEEKELKVYFTGESVPSHLEKYKDLFQYFTNESQVTASSEVNLTTQTSKVPWYTWIGVAASIALIVGLFVKDIPSEEHQEGVYGTYDDPEIALQKTKEALNLVAHFMNEGTKDLVYLNEFETAKKELVHLNEFENTKNKLTK